MNPETARSLWRQLLRDAPKNDIADRHLQALIDSVVVDIINNKIMNDNEFAMVIGKRIDVLRYGKTA